MRLGVQCKVLRNNTPLSSIKEDSYAGIVLSPGPGTPEQANNLMEVVDHYHDKLPILGICLGHQALGQYFGATLQKADKPMHGKLSEIITSKSFLFDGLPSPMQVVRYHSLILKDIPEQLVATSTTHDGEIMSFTHRYLPIGGMQFHPEAALTTYGLKMLENWVSFHNITNGN
jgi:anthranilate synthase component 2